MRGRRALLVALTLLALAPLAGARGGGYRIRLLPGASFAAVWSVSTPANRGCPLRAGPVLVEPNPWNLKPASRGAACVPSATPTGSTTGTFAWRSGRGGLRLSVALDRTQRVHPAIPVAAYPEVIYGWSPYLALASRQRAALRFPIRAAALVRRQPDPVLTTVYRICSSCLRRATIDLAYDLWLSPDALPRWCGHGSPPPPQCIHAPSDAIELMIWLAHSPGFTPAGRVVPAATLSAPAWLDGRHSHLRFRVFVCKPCAHSIVSFVLAQAAGARTPLGLARAAVSLFLHDFVSHGLQLLGRSPAGAGYLNGVEFGAEVAPAHDGDPTRFWLSLSQYCLQAPPQTVAASGACS